jgi:hypothetical protein
MSKAQSMEDRLNEPEPEVWTPQDDKDDPTPTLTGVIESIAIRPGKDGRPSYPAVTVVGEDGTRRVWLAWHKVGKSRLAELQPQVGERIGVKYLGTHPKGYENYRVVVDRPEPEPSTTEVDWSVLTDTSSAGGFNDEWLPPPEEPEDQPSY